MEHLKHSSKKNGIFLFASFGISGLKNFIVTSYGKIISKILFGLTKM